MDTRTSLLRISALLAIASALVACGDDAEKGPTGQVGINLDGGFSPIIDAGLNPDAGAQPQADGGPQQPTGDCKGTNGCYSCKPTKNEEFLNACAQGCVPFDNAARLPGYQAGKPLPAL